MVQDIANAHGDTLIYDSSAPGGYTFGNHFNDPTTKSKIAAGNWDYVVLQAQSQEPSFPPAQVNSQTFPYAVLLDSLIKHYNRCATTVFYETWGRKFGDAANCPNYPPLCTYTGMQNRLRESYKLFADSTHALMAPVGEAFRLSIAATPTLDLYQADQSHPSMEGSYLAASVFYEVLFQKSVLNTPYNAGLAAGTATFLNQVAHQLTSDSIIITNVPKYIPKASFTFTAQGVSGFQFQSGNPSFSHKWYFGDGNTSSAINPLHVYANSGTYPVSLVVYHAPDCKKDSVSALIQVTVPTNLFESKQRRLKIYPNPCSEFLNIEMDRSRNSKVRILDISGQVVYEAENVLRISTSSFSNGFYFVDLYDSVEHYHSCFIKNE